MTAILLITLQKNSICIQKNEDLPLIRELKKKQVNYTSISEAVVQRDSLKNVFLKISKNL